MSERTEELKERLRNTWDAFTPRRKVIVTTSAVVLLAALGFGVHMSMQQDMDMLYGGIEMEEVGRISDALRERGIAFKVRSGGRIMVPAERVSQIRADLAVQGLPRSGVGYELFDQQSPFGLSEFSERIAFQRARSGELARSIMALDPIERAVVHIVDPEKNIFRNDDQRPRASVVVRLHPGARLATPQVEGISRIIAGAVAGLAIEDVSIVDERGNPLGAAVSGTARGGLEMQESIEQALVRKAQDVLLAVAGRGGAVVKISAEIDMDRIEETIETYDADGRVAQSENTRTRERGPAAGAAAKGGDKELEETSDASFLVPRTTQKILRAAGGLKRLSVALLVDQGLKERLPEMERLVKRAIGFQEGRDDFEAVATALDPGELTNTAPMQMTPRLVSRIVEGGVSILAILALIAMARALRPSKPGKDIEDPIVRQRELRAKLKREQHERQVRQFEDQIKVQERNDLLVIVQSLVSAHPHVASEVLRRWLYQDQGTEGNDEGGGGEA